MARSNKALASQAVKNADFTALQDFKKVPMPLPTSAEGAFRLGCCNRNHRPATEHVPNATTPAG